MAKSRVAKRKKRGVKRLARKVSKTLRSQTASIKLTTRAITKLTRWTRSESKRRQMRISLSYTPKKRQRIIKRVARKPKKHIEGNIMSSWLESAKRKIIAPLGSKQTEPKKEEAPVHETPKPSSPKKAGALDAAEYERLIKQLYQMIGNENKALKKVVAENTRLKLELQTTRNRLKEVHLPISVRRARARSMDRLSIEAIRRICSFLNDDELFSNRGLCVEFYKGFLLQEIKTARRADSTNMKRLVRIAKIGRMFLNVSIVLVNWENPTKNVLRHINRERFPSMCELVVESNASFAWSTLQDNPNVKIFTVLNARLNLKSITKERFANLEYLTFKPSSYKDLAKLPNNRTITRIDLVNIDLKSGLTVNMMKPLARSRFPNLKMVGVLTEVAFPVKTIHAVWSHLLRKHLHFRYTCRDYDFTDGRVTWYTDKPR